MLKEVERSGNKWITNGKVLKKVCYTNSVELGFRVGRPFLIPTGILLSSFEKEMVT
jgi:hypothetical protein